MSYYAMVVWWSGEYRAPSLPWQYPVEVGVSAWQRFLYSSVFAITGLDAEAAAKQ